MILKHLFSKCEKIVNNQSIIRRNLSRKTSLCAMQALLLFTFGENSSYE